MEELVAELGSEETPFQLDDLGEDVFRRSYAYDKEETWEQASLRVSRHVAEAEDNGKRIKWTERFYNELVTNRFMPGGRIWYSAGRNKAQSLNCFVIPVSDSREGWGQMLKESIIICNCGWSFKTEVIAGFDRFKRLVS